MQQDTCIPMLIAALLTIDKTWKQPNVHQQMYSIPTMEYYSAIKKNKIMPFAATWMKLKTLILSEIKSERERKIPYDIIYVWYLIYSTKEPFHRKENHGLGE